MLDPTTNPNGQIHLQKFEKGTIQHMLKFIYSDKVDNAIIDMDLLAIANYLGLETLQVLCERELCNQLDVSNALDAWMNAYMFSRPHFEEICEKYISSKWKEVQCSDSFSRLKKENPEGMLELTVKMLNLSYDYLSTNDLLMTKT